MKVIVDDPDCYTIGWITALPIERAVATALLDECYKQPNGFEQHPSDVNSYTWGRIGEHNLVIASLPVGSDGNVSAATTVSNLLSSLPHIKIGLLVGTGGGVALPNEGQDIRLGDVVVGQPGGKCAGVIQYDLGKATSDETWERKGFLDKPPRVLLSALSKLQAEHEIAASKIPDILQEMWAANPQMRGRDNSQTPGYIHKGFEHDRLFKSQHDHAGGSSCANCDESWEIKRQQRETTGPEIHYGTIASGNVLIKDAKTRDKIIKQIGEGCVCFEMEAAGLMDAFPCLVIRGISDYADSHKNDRWQRYAAATAAAYAKELLGFVAAGQIRSMPRAVDMLGLINKDIKHIQYSTERMTEEVQMIRTTILDMNQKSVLDQLSIAAGASFDSHSEEHNPTCLPNTRSDLLDQIHRWAGETTMRTVFWLNGMAGTGKSTISRTVACNLAQTENLGASFFFKRGQADRADLSKFFTTITADLVFRHPAVARYVKDALDTNPAITNKTMQEQFDKLVLEPLALTSLHLGKVTPIVIVIDALDECEGDDDIKRLIRLFSSAKKLSPTRLKLFITSRPDLPIRLGFHEIEGDIESLILQEIDESVVKQDLAVFLDHELGNIRSSYNASVSKERRLGLDWPGKSIIQALVNMASPLFIFASTTCLFIADRRCGNPDNQLRKVLHYQTKSQESKLDATYLPVLDRQVFGLSQRQKEEVLQQFRLIVGSIVILEDPLPVYSLARILDQPKENLFVRLDLLHSVLSIPLSTKLPLRLLHLSFRDFLLDPEKSEWNPFWIDERKAHYTMASNCLRMLKGLKQDICDLKAPGTLCSSVPQETISTYLPPEMQYSCLYWVTHLQQADARISDADEVYHFLTCHLLHWMEALSLIGRASEIRRLIRILQSLVEPRGGAMLSDLLHDAERFILANNSAIISAPLQLYSSLLTFAPERSKMRATFKAELAPWIILEPTVESHWSRWLQILDGHLAEVYSVAFSHDSTLLASASYNRTIRIWRTATGETLQVLEGHCDTIWSVTFSHDSALVASASNDKTVRIWCTDTGEALHILEGHRAEIYSVAFSHDSALIASSSGDWTIRIWCTNTGNVLKTLEGHSNAICSVVFSHDSALIASASDDETIRIWRTNTGETIQVLVGHQGWVSSVAFSHDSLLLASASHDWKIRIWRTDTGESLHCLVGHRRPVNCVAFSHDSTLVVSAANDEDIRIWSVDTGEALQVLEGHRNAVYSAAFSHDSSLIASASHDETVRIWRVDTSESLQAQERHRGSVWSVAISPDSKLVASASDDMTVRIRRADTGQGLQILGGHRGPVRAMIFSYDSMLLASASSDKTVRVWRVDTGEMIQVFEGHRLWVSSVALSRDSMLVASGSFDKRVRIWRTETGDLLHVLEGHEWAVRSVAFSYDSGLLASASNDWTARIWRTNTGELLQVLEGHGDDVGSITFSHDSAVVISASLDKTIRIWHTDTGECMQTIPVGAGLSCLSFQPGTLFLVTDCGVFDMRAIVSTPTTADSAPEMVPHRRIEIGISTDRSWITWYKDNLLWIPPGFRPRCSAVSGSTVAIGSDSGQVVIIRLSPRELPELMQRAY